MNKVNVDQLLRQVFGEVRDRAEPGYEKHCDDFVFHMTDWLHDMEGLQRLYRELNDSSTDAAEFVIGFLCHVIPHLNAAGRLLLGEISDPFKHEGENGSTD
jgi:hypothetical protein